MNQAGMQRVIDWVAARQGDGGVAAIGPDTDLLASGAIDSMGLVSLFFLVETLRGAPVDMARATAAEAAPLTPARIAERWL
jgi:acyl carrier protein